MSDKAQSKLSRSELPEGTVTFLFTDIEGSTELLKQLGDDYATVLADQRRILREIFSRWNGQEVDTQGDSFFVSFPRATEAVTAAAEIQSALTEHAWPENSEVRVRMGLHTGEPLVAEEGYVGIDVHRAARIAHVGHGGQVLLSETTYTLVLDSLPDGVELLNLGRHLLKDIRSPEHIRQLVIEGLQSEFPPLKSLEMLPNVDLRGPRQVGPCPFRGMAAFQEHDAPFFYGREAFTNRLTEAVKTKPMVAVIIGSSGSGKSSAVFAGLLPRLRQTGGWGIAVLRPGGEPFQALGGALLSLLEPDLSETGRLTETLKLADKLKIGEVNTFQIVERILEVNLEARQVLLVIDQFEELYTLSPEIESQRHFIDKLLAAVDRSSSRRLPPLVILVTMRADFMGHALTHRPFADALQEASLIMGPMTRDELRRAIEAPAEQQGAAFEPGLVERVLDDVGEEPGNLPLLEFALTLLWERQSDGWLTHEDYEALGCVEGALASYADEVYGELYGDERGGARRIFVQLVRPGEGTEDTRRLATFDELGEHNWDLVQHLADSRLVVTGRDTGTGDKTVEVVHEALIQRWGRLREWMVANRAFRTWQERLRASRRGWEASQRDEGALLRGAPLVEAESWLVERGDDLAPAEREYIQSSIELRRATQTRRDRRRRNIVVGLTTGLLIALVLAIVALRARSTAMREAAVNHSLVLSASAQDAQDNGEVDLALALALEAVSMDQPPPEARRTLSAVALGPGTRAVLTGNSNSVRDVAISPDGKTALSVSCAELSSDEACTQGEVILWDLETGTEQRRFEGHSGWVNAVAFDPDGKTALSGSGDTTLILWDVETGQMVRHFEGHARGVTSVAFGPEGQTALSGSDDTTLILWDVTTGKAIRRFEGHTGGVNCVAFSSDGQIALSGSGDTTLILWDVSTGEEIRRFEGHISEVIDVVFNLDGRTMLSSGDYTLRLWDLETGEEIRQANFPSKIKWLVTSPDGRTVLVGGIGPDLRLWDIEHWQEVQTLLGARQAELIMPESAAISPDGLLAFSGSSDGSLRLWNLEGQAGVRRFETDGPPLSAVAVSPDGGHLLTGDMTDQTVLWDVERGEVLRRFVGHAVAVSPNAVAFSPDGKYALVGSSDAFSGSNAKSLVLWDVESGQRIRNFEGHRSILRSAALSPDGRMALSGSQGDYGNDLILWDVETGEQIRRFDTEDDITSITFSADGGLALTGSVFGSNLTLWDVATGQQIRRFEGPVDLVFDVAFGPDEKTVLSASGDGSLTLWDVETGDIIRRYLGHDSWVWSLDVSTDGRYLLSGAEDGVVILWDFETGEELRRLKGHTAVVSGLVFSPDGQTVFSVSFDGALIEWQISDLPLDELIEWTYENRYIRELTCEEREKYRFEPLCKDSGQTPTTSP